MMIPVARGLSRGGGNSALVPGTSGTLYATNYSTTGVPAIGTGANSLHVQATRAQTGSIWGLANDADKRVFSGAFLKRHVPMGPSGMGAIYVTEVDTGTAPNGTLATIPNSRAPTPTGPARPIPPTTGSTTSPPTRRCTRSVSATST